MVQANRQSEKYVRSFHSSSVEAMIANGRQLLVVGGGRVELTLSCHKISEML